MSNFKSSSENRYIVNVGYYYELLILMNQDKKKDDFKCKTQEFYGSSKCRSQCNYCHKKYGHSDDYDGHNDKLYMNEDPPLQQNQLYRLKRIFRKIKKHLKL